MSPATRANSRDLLTATTSNFERMSLAARCQCWRASRCFPIELTYSTARQCCAAFRRLWLGEADLARVSALMSAHPTTHNRCTDRAGRFKKVCRRCRSSTASPAPLQPQPPSGDLCHKAPTRAVTRTSRSSATGSIDNSPRGILLRW
jgi:hypothetical protein